MAAVALPQYQKAVEKSHVTQAITAARAIKDAEEIYYLANGTYTDDLEELGIDVPTLSGFTVDSGTAQYQRISLTRNMANYCYSIVYSFDHRDGAGNRRFYCVNCESANNAGRRKNSANLCKSFGGKLVWGVAGQGQESYSIE